MRHEILKCANEFPNMRFGSFIERVMNIIQETSPKATLFSIEDVDLINACQDYVKIHKVETNG